MARIFLVAIWLRFLSHRDSNRQAVHNTSLTMLTSRLFALYLLALVASLPHAAFSAPDEVVYTLANDDITVGADFG